MEQIRPYLNSNYGFALAGALIAIALSLRAMGILGLVVSFWSGFAFCLGLEAFAIYYFLLKIDTKTQAKLEEYVLAKRKTSSIRPAKRQHFVGLLSAFKSLLYVQNLLN
jgi:hypothetical protein